MTICKQLYFADKEHLVKFGRPITGDTYYRLEHGQIPTRGLDMMRQKSSPQANALFEKYVSVIGNSVHPKRPADKKVFSKSDLEILDWVVENYGSKTAAELRRLTHKEPTYSEATEGCPIDFELFFKGAPNSESIKALAEREQENRDVLRRYGAE
ncbi:MAG TPA: Panacea domain-containing protein [Terriglobia bacterium]|nr:Panacea domain-containing protein [Terriglobia bacterium]